MIVGKRYSKAARDGNGQQNCGATVVEAGRRPQTVTGTIGGHHNTIDVTRHCVQRVRERALGHISYETDVEIARWVRRSILNGRRATARESRAILDAVDRWREYTYGTNLPVAQPREHGRASCWFVLSGVYVFVVVRNQARSGSAVITTMWALGVFDG